MSFSILGTGSALPAKIITNEDLTKLVETNDEWIRTRTGIAQRRVCSEESVTDLAYTAAVRALEDSGCRAEELDLIICATITPEYQTPSMACLLQERLGAHCAAFDINAACSGLIYGLDIAASYFTRRPQQKILLVGAEMMSRMVDWQDRGTCVLFGDGAGAMVLGPGDDLLGIQISAQGTAGPLYALARDGNCPFRQQQEEKSPYLVMEGQEVFRFAVTAMVQTVETAMAQAGLTKDEITYLLPHQANIRIIDSAVSRLKFPKEKCLTNIASYGNMSAACIGVLLDESNKAGKFKKGDLLALTAFGAGLTTGACILRWNK